MAFAFYILIFTIYTLSLSCCMFTGTWLKSYTETAARGDLSGAMPEQIKYSEVRRPLVAPYGSAL